MVITMSWSSVAVVTVISLEMVWSSVGMEIWNVVVLIGNVRISMTVVMSPRVIVSTISMSVVSSVVSVVISTMSVVLVVSVIGWSEVAVVLPRRVSVMLWKITLVMSVVPGISVVGWNGVSKWSVFSWIVDSSSNIMVNGMLEVWVLFVMSINFVSNSTGWVMEVSVVWANIGIMVIIEMNLSSVVVWFKVNIMLHGVAFNLMDSVVSIWSPSMSTIMSPGLVSGEKIMYTSIVMGISCWVMD